MGKEHKMANKNVPIGDKKRIIEIRRPYEPLTPDQILQLTTNFKEDWEIRKELNAIYLEGTNSTLKKYNRVFPELAKAGYVIII